MLAAIVTNCAAEHSVQKFASFSLTSRTVPRNNKLITLEVAVEGYRSGSSIRCWISEHSGGKQYNFTHLLTGAQETITFQVPKIGYGRFNALIELIDAHGRIVDYRKQFFEVLRVGKKPYLNMVSFYVPPIGTKGEKLLNQLPALNDAPYSGVAIPFIGYNGSGPVPSYETLRPLLKKMRNILEIDPWPWVSLNRMLGPWKDALDFEGLDFNDDIGARKKMLAVWRMAVRAAQEWNSPGIVFDMEFYKRYRMYNPVLLAKARGISVEQTIRECELLGEELAKIIAEEYPQCIVWSLFSRLDHTYTRKDTGTKVVAVPGYITLGMLKYARLMDIPMKFLCGGENTLHYTSKDVDQLLHKITVRDNMLEKILKEYPDHFFWQVL
ncbi:MAG: hypothetical protein D3913_04375 [Candidatus Electrothrix sp. LOE1_4_5]|nr:hypothetical protein [Candidatus Electrothrix gigas]